MFIVKLRNWIIPFKLARLHDGGKLTKAGGYPWESVYKAGRVTLLLG